MKQVWRFAALALAAGSLLLPPLVLLAIIAYVFALLFVEGRARLQVALVAAPLLAVGLFRFVVGWMMPNLVSAGQRAAEERAVSRLREVLWAERRVLELGYVDSNQDGVAEFALLSELLAGDARPGARPEAAVLKPDMYRPIAGHAGIYQADGYLLALYLPSADGRGARAAGPGAALVDVSGAAGATRRFVAYAWPAALDQNGRRVFAIDQDDHVCETENPQGYAGPSHAPDGNAAPRDLASCGMGGDGHVWRRWRKLGR